MEVLLWSSQCLSFLLLGSLIINFFVRGKSRVIRAKDVKKSWVVNDCGKVRLIFVVGIESEKKW